MLKTLGIKNNTSFTIINIALKNISRRVKDYPWFADFTATKKIVEKLAKQEEKGNPVSKEDRQAIYAKLEKYSFHTNVLAGLEKAKVYDFNELKEKAKSTLLGEKAEKGFSTMIANIESLKNLQEDNLPKINSKLGYGIKEKSGILFFTSEFRHFEIYNTFPLAYLVYPGWVLENVLALVIDKSKIKSEKEQQKIVMDIANERKLFPHEAQKSNKYLYVVFLPKTNFTMKKIFILGRKYIPQNNTLKKRRENARLIAKDLLLEIESTNKVIKQLNLSLAKEQKQLEVMKNALNSPTVKLSSMVNDIAMKQKVIAKIKESLTKAQEHLDLLEEKKQKLIEKVKLSNV